jgi:ubiquinol oxidase
MLRVVEVVARVPYESWSSVGFVGLTHTHHDPELARAIENDVVESRDQNDNELWHLLIIEEMLAGQGYRQTFWREQAIPQLLALGYYQLRWLLYAVHPRWSYALNADFEDHAVSCYAQFVADNAQFDGQPRDSNWGGDYDPYHRLATVGDLFRRICADEVEHRDTSLEHIRNGARGHK